MIDGLRHIFHRHPQVSDRRLLASPQTLFGSALVYDQVDDRGDTVRFLSVNGLKESATYLDERWNELVFDYTKRYDLMFAAGIPLRRVLMIGGGGYSYPKYLISHRGDVTMDVVEMDAAITELAHEFFFLDRLEQEYGAQASGRLNLICDDGRVFAENCAAQPGGRYDAVLNDSFAAGVPAPSLTTVEAARAVHGCLVPGGLYLSNVVSSLKGQGSRFLHAQVKTLSQVFRQVHVVPCDANGLDFMRDNLMVIASDGDYRFPGERPVMPAQDAPVLTDANNPVRDLIDW